MAKSMNKLGIFRLEQALSYFPRTYQDRRAIPSIARVPRSGTQLVTGHIVAVSVDESKVKVAIVRVRIQDASGVLDLVFFNQKYLVNVLRVGAWIVALGKIEHNGFSGQYTVTVSEFDLIRDDLDRRLLMGRIVPIYGLTHGVYQAAFRSAITQLVTRFASEIDDYLPVSILKKLNLMPLSEAVMQLHLPVSPEMGLAARQRIAFDELFHFQLEMMLKREIQSRQLTGIQIDPQSKLVDQYLQALPYRLTDGQAAVVRHIQSDFQTGYVMNRMVQGDVGCGKTDVLVIALLMAIDSGYKGAVMVPTEVLALQHYDRFARQLSPFGVSVYLMKGGQRSVERRAALAALAGESPVVVVGTHALIEAPVTINRLGLVVIDEQHRFGVMQRMALAQKGPIPHALFTTATPIPRSFMLTVFGDLDQSLITDMPAGRTPIQTDHVRKKHAESAWQVCVSELEAGRQIYVVYPLIEESEKLDLASAIDGYEALRTTVFSATTVGLMHGRLSPSDKQQVMAQFKAGHIRVLVSTTVIEVGVDVPNATVMVIMNAERFGLSQLHQLRGRVGRGMHRGLCVLVGDPKSEESRKRIEAMVSTTDGFKLAELDLRLRGPGELLGTRQSGLPDFKIADLVRDESLLQLAQKVANRIVSRDPQLSHPDHAGIRRWVNRDTELSMEHRLN